LDKERVEKIREAFMTGNLKMIKEKCENENEIYGFHATLCIKDEMV